MDWVGSEGLLARLEALLRRQQRGQHKIEFGEVTVDLESHEVTRNGQQADLSSKELELLLFLVRRPRRVLSRDTIFQSVWGEPHASERVVDYHLMNLRKKLETDPSKPEFLITRRGRGFEFRGSDGKP